VGETRALRPEERRTLALLGVPTGALALATTVVTSFLPVTAREVIGSSALTGVLIGIEGAMALWVPLVVGSWSDRLRTPIGGRLPFLIAGTPLLAAALLALASAGALPLVAVAVAVFYLAYFVAYEPYRALYPDLVDDEIAGRAQSTQSIWRGAGTGVALVGGGLLVAVGSGAPFVVAAAATVVATAAFVPAAVRRRAADAQPRGAHASARELAGLLRTRGDLRAFLLANGLWEASLGALKTFVFLYVVVGLGRSEPFAAAVVGGVAVVALVAAAVGGALGDRLGRQRLMRLALPLYGVGLLVPAFTHAPVAIGPLLLVVGFAGGLVMTLPYAILQPLMPDDRHGALTGLYSLSRGVGTALGPLCAGVAVQLLDGPFAGTRGYAAMWLVCGGAILLSIPPTLALRRRSDDGAAPP